jgi:two-component system, sensor histidine kinase
MYLTRRLVVWILVLSIVGALIFITMTTMFAGLNERQQNIKSSVRESVVWAAFQADREAGRFIRSLLAASNDATVDALVNVRTRYDVLYSRASILTEARFSDHFGNGSAVSAIAHATNQMIVDMATEMDRLRRDEELKAALPRLLAKSEQIREQTEALLLQTNAANNEARVGSREVVKRGYWRIAMSVVMLTVVLVLLVVLLLIQLAQLLRAGRQLSLLNERSERAKEEAEAGNRAKSAFLSSMSHEIRTPLNAIVGMTEVLAQTPLQTFQADQLSVIRRSGDHLLDVINDILDFLKLESGAVDVNLVQFNLSDVIDSVRSLLAARAEERGLQLTFQAPDISIRCDPSRVRQVLINLVGNAIKFTPKGRVQVRIAEIGTARLRCEVQDTGIGIAAESVSCLFKEFSQVDGSFARRFAGTGLGLAICKRLIEALGGTIDLVSSLGKGTTFWFEIPVDPIRPPLPRMPAIQAAGVEPGKFHGRVLVVDENPINQQVACNLLKKLGLETDSAGDGAEALRKVGHEPYDIVFMDMQMPVLDGLETTRRLRANAYTQPIVGLTPNAFTSDREACLAAGMDESMPKPVTLAKLVGILAPRLKPKVPEPDAEARGAGKSRAEVTPAVKPQRSESTVAADRKDGYLAALINELGSEVYKTLLDAFAADGSRLVDEIRSTNDVETRDRNLHTLMGSALTLGLDEIAGLAQAARKGGTEADEALNRLAELVPAAARIPVARCA